MPTRLILVLSLAAVMGCHKQRPIYSPVNVAVAGTQAPEQVGATIRRTMIERGWTVVREGPGVIDAQIAKSKFWATVRAAYNAQTVTLSYLDSDGLNYRRDARGREVIHDHFNVWMKNLERDVRVALSR